MTARFFRVFTAAFAAVMAVLFLFSTPTYAAGFCIEDNSGLYNEESRAYLEGQLEEITEYTGWNIGIVTLNYDFSSLGGARNFSEDKYDKLFGRSSSGVLYVCDVGYRYIVVAGDAEKYINGQRFESMLDEVNDLYMDYDDLGSASVFIAKTKEYYDKGPGLPVSMSVLLLGVLFFIAAFLVTYFSICKSYSKYQKPDTRNYIDRRSLDIYRRQDVFLRQYTTTSSSSHGGGGGGGHHGGGGAGGHR
ncbi:MAG: hypothetical protein ACI4KF_00110 [Huintestinicola sp.]